MCITGGILFYKCDCDNETIPFSFLIAAIWPISLSITLIYCGWHAIVQFIALKIKRYKNRELN